MLNNIVKDGLFLTVAAQLFSLPLVAYYFKAGTIMGILANTCLFWFVPILFVGGMIGSTILVFCSPFLVTRPLCFIVGWFLDSMASLFLSMIRVLAANDMWFLKFALNDAKQVIYWWIIVIIVLVAIDRSVRKKYGNFNCQKLDRSFWEVSK